MYNNAAEVGGERLPRGWVEWIRPYLGWFFLICIVTSLLCGTMSGDWHNDFDINDIFDDTTNEPKMTVTASGFLSIYPEFLDNNIVRVTSNSTLPVDVEAKAEDGREIFSYYGLKPGESFYFQIDDSCTTCTITASAA